MLQQQLKEANREKKSQSTCTALFGTQANLY